MDLLTQWDEEKYGRFNEFALLKKVERLYPHHMNLRCVFPPGYFAKMLTSPAERVCSMIQGTLAFKVGGKPFTLKPGDSLLIPRHTIHEIVVVGTTPVLIIDSARYL